MACLFTLGQSFSHAVTRQEYVNNLINQAEKYSKQNGKQAIALAYINEAIKLDPRNANLYYKRASIFGHMGQYPYAIEDLNKFVNNSKYPHAIRLRADCFMAIGEFQRAANDYSVFLSHAPNDGKVWSYLTEALALMGKKEAAMAATRKGLATNSHWSSRLNELQMKILLGEKIIPHKPFSN
jgi:tetratricopeptide (TPR) repeat protein